MPGQDVSYTVLARLAQPLPSNENQGIVSCSLAPADKRDFIWVIFGGNGTKNEVWRGRLNRLGFEIQ